MKRLFIAAASLCCMICAEAKIELPNILGSGMVLQHSADVNIWGKANPDSKVTVKTSWSKDKIVTRSDSEGKWSTVVATPKASFTPLSLTISDGEPLTLDNVLAGDVWICSGQSNMEMPLHGNTSQAIEGSLDCILKAATESSKLRFFTVGRERSYNKELDNCSGQWECASSKSVSDFSAVGYFFGRMIADAVDIPIGLIATDWGDTKVETWMPLDALKQCVTPEQFKAKHGNHWSKPSELYCSMIAPIRNFKAKGFIWYQGESNLGDIDHYDVMLAKMVESWRKDWGDTDNSMPFYFVQIAPFIYGGSREIAYPLFVESQLRAVDRIPNSGMAGTTDIGEEYSIHPGKKREVGQRLAALALAQTYGMEGFEPKMPRLESYEVKDGKMILKMSNAGRGMNPWTLVPLIGFEIAGADKVFHPAKAWTSDKPCDVITVWSDEVKQPVAVRYAFRNFIPANLTNTYGIPAAPFRTDDWNDVK
ncbi:MAG: sialate O-acetylesterase [Muribaculaceae bacterium]|nr:sialate O-acetylesterase [Muribaculaceae bacterium]